MSISKITMLLIVVSITLALPVMLFSNNRMNNRPSITNTTGNVSVVLYSVVTPTTHPTVEGVRYSAEPPLGLRVTAILSNSTARLGGDIVIRVVLEGEKAADVGIVHIEILNSSGQKVYGLNMWIPHTTLTPIDRNKPIWFDEVLHIPKDIEPGIYKVVVEAYTNNEKTSTERTISIVK